jgi:hypothetical protein
VTDIDGLCWWKSTRSGNQGGNCIEVAASGDTWYVRDSKDPAAGHLMVDVADEAAARLWAGKIAEACGWPQEVRRVG